MPLPHVPTPPPPPSALRHRGSVKALMLVLLLASVVGGAGGLIFVATGGMPEDTLEVTTATTHLPQRLVLLSLAGILNAGGAVGMWSFRRWGVYGVVCASLFAFVVNYRVGGVPVALPGLIAVSCLAVFALALWVEFD